MKWLILALAIVSNVSANLLIKFSIMPPRKPPSIAEPMATLSNWPFWLGAGIFGVSLLLYATALSRLPLSVVHPILSTTTVAAVALASMLIFREPFHWTTATGIVLVIVGVTLITIQAA